MSETVRVFTSYMRPMLQGVQRREDWPELSANLVADYNRYQDPVVWEELMRRTNVAGNLNSFYDVFIPYVKARDWMELTRYARLYRGEAVQGEFPAGTIGMLLPLKGGV